MFPWNVTFNKSLKTKLLPVKSSSPRTPRTVGATTMNLVRMRTVFARSSPSPSISFIYSSERQCDGTATTRRELIERNLHTSCHGILLKRLGILLLLPADVTEHVRMDVQTDIGH